MRNKFLTLLLILFLSCSFAGAKSQKEEYKNDGLYSEEYFNYIIEQASIDRQIELEKKAKEQKQLEDETKNKEKKTSKADIADEISMEIELAKEAPDEIIVDDYVPLKIMISETITQPKYSETFKKVNSKTIIPVNNRFSFIQNTSKTRNKYNSNDYKILAGSELSICDFFDIEAGLETNYRGIDQNPQSRKLYVTPTVRITDKVSLSFVNKYNPQTGSSDHDLSLKISPMKSKAFDFGIYSSITRYDSGKIDESISFSTNIYLK